jgi:hypothetical protein
MLIVMQFYKIRLKVDRYKAFSEKTFVVYHLYVLFFLTSNAQPRRNSSAVSIQINFEKNFIFMLEIPSVFEIENLFRNGTYLV